MLHGNFQSSFPCSFIHSHSRCCPSFEQILSRECLGLEERWASWWKTKRPLGVSVSMKYTFYEFSFFLTYFLSHTHTHTHTLFSLSLIVYSSLYAFQSHTHILRTTIHHSVWARCSLFFKYAFTLFSVSSFSHLMMLNCQCLSYLFLTSSSNVAHWLWNMHWSLTCDPFVR